MHNILANALSWSGDALVDAVLNKAMLNFEFIKQYMQ